MQYSIDDFKPCFKKVTVTVPAEEINASIMSTAALYKKDNKANFVKGFRRGKAPASYFAQHFHKQIFAEARQDLLSVHIQQIIQETGITPLANVNFDNVDDFEYGSDYNYSFTVEVLPSFELPNYEGLEVEQLKTPEPTQAEVEEYCEDIRKVFKEYIPAPDMELAQDGMAAVIDFSVFHKSKKILDEKNYRLQLTPSESLQDFIAFIKETKVGQSAERKLKIPNGFINDEIAGKTCLFKLTVHSLYHVFRPKNLEELAAHSKYKTIEKLFEAAKDSVREELDRSVKSKAAEDLIVNLLKVCDFPIPPIFVELFQNYQINRLKNQMERQGKKFEPTDDELAQMKAAYLPHAEFLARVKVLLLTIAKKESLQVSEEEVRRHVVDEAERRRMDPNALYEEYRSSGEIHNIYDLLLQNKASNLVYARAHVTIVEKQAEENSQAEAAKTEENTSAEVATAEEKAEEPKTAESATKPEGEKTE